MAQEKVLAVRVEVTGLTQESRQIQQLDQELGRLAKTRKEYNEIIKSGRALSDKQRADLVAIAQKTRDLNAEKRRLLKTETDSARAFTAAKGSMEALRAETAKLRNEAEKLNTTTTEGKRRFEQISTQITRNTTKIRDYDRSLSGSSTLVGEYSLGVKKAFASIGAAIASIYGAWRGFKSVVESTDVTADEFARTMMAAKTSLDYFKKSLATGDFSNFFTNMEKAIKLGKEYADQIDDIGNRRRAMAITEAAANVEIQSLQKTLRSATATDEQRIEAGKRIITIEQDLADTRTKIAGQAIDARIESLGMLKITREILQANLVSYETNRDLIAQADEYNERLKTRKDLTVLYANTTIPLFAKEREGLAELNAQIEGTDRKVIEFAELRSKYNKLNEKELDELVGMFQEYYNAVASADENTQRAASRLSSLLAKDAQAAVTAISSEKKALEDLRRELNQFFGFQPEKAFKPKSKSGAIKGGKAPGLEIQIQPTGVPDLMTSAMAAQSEGMAETAAQAERLAQTYGEVANSVIYLSEALGELAVSGKLSMKSLMVVVLETAKQFIAAMMARSMATVVAKEVEKKGILGVILGIAGMALVSGVFSGIQDKLTEGTTGYATGGKISRGLKVKPDARGDDTLILARKGEVVLTEAQQRSIGGAAMFKHLGVPGFAAGGVVGPQSLNFEPIERVDVDRLAALIIKGINDKQVNLVMSDLDRAQNTLKIIKQPKGI